MKTKTKSLAHKQKIAASVKKSWELRRAKQQAQEIAYRKALVSEMELLLEVEKCQPLFYDVLLAAFVLFSKAQFKQFMKALKTFEQAKS